MLTCSKKYTDIAFAHRAPHHEGHCRLIHGHNWSFDITFAGEPDKNGFVMDFGKLKDLRETFDAVFDHKLLINESDPLKEDILEFLRLFNLDNVTLVNDCSCEGVAQLVHKLASSFVLKVTDGRVNVMTVRVCEDSKNLATYSG